MNDYRPYRIEEFTPDWKNIFKLHAKRIRDVLGHEIIAIGHVGSTSIPGMIAKPNIDIMVTVPDISRIANYRDKMESFGYISHGDYSHIHEEYFTEDLPSGERVVSIHVLQTGNPEITRHLNFRDYLMANKEARELYIKTKRDLYAKHQNHYRAYDNGKQAVIDQLNREAQEWGASNSSSG